MLIIAFLILIMQIQSRKLMNPFNIVKFEPCFPSYFSFYHSLPFGEELYSDFVQISGEHLQPDSFYRVKKWVLEYRSVKAKKRADLKVIKDWELDKLWGWNILFYTKKFLVQALLFLYQITKGFTNGKQKQKGRVEFRAVVLNEAVFS